MTNSYLLELIKALHTGEQEEMKVLLAERQFSGQGNAREMAQLYLYILSAAPDFGDVQLNKDSVYAALYPDAKEVPGKLEKLMSDLAKLIRKYLLGKQYFSEDKEEQQQLDWVMLLRERGLTSRAQPLLKKLKNKRDSDKTESLEHYRSDLRIAEEAHEWESTFNKFDSNLKIPELIRQLDLYYYNYRKELQNRYLIQQAAAHLPELDIVAVNENYYLKESTLLQISTSIYELLSQPMPSEQDFRSLMQLLHTNEDILSFQTLSQFHTYLRNACTLLINAGHTALTPILHEIQKDNLQRGLFFFNGEMSPNAYINLMIVALRVKAYDWAKSFTEQYKDALVGGDKDRFFYRYNLAHCFFAEGKYSEALDNIPDTPSTSHYHHIIRRLELKALFELRSDLLHYKTFAYRKYVERTAPKTIAANLRAMDLNFVNLLLQVSNSPLKDKARSEKLIQRIEQKRLLSDRPWLLEKAQELR